MILVLDWFYNGWYVSQRMIQKFYVLILALKRAKLALALVKFQGFFWPRKRKKHFCFVPGYKCCHHLPTISYKYPMNDAHTFCSRLNRANTVQPTELGWFCRTNHFGILIVLIQNVISSQFAFYQNEFSVVWGTLRNLIVIIWNSTWCFKFVSYWLVCVITLEIIFCH